jgi:RNA polymerase sigma-70 factor (ECF subfamily)
MARQFGGGGAVIATSRSALDSGLAGITREAFPEPEGQWDTLVNHQVRRLTHCRAFSRSDAADLSQELRLEIWRRMPAYDPKRGRRGTFVRHLLENKSISLVRTKIAGKRDFRKNADSQNGRGFEPGVDMAERANTLDASACRSRRGLGTRNAFESSDVRNDVARVVSTLPCDLQKLCRLLGDMTVTETSKELGQSRQKVYAAISRLRQRFEDAGLQAYV